MRDKGRISKRLGWSSLYGFCQKSNMKYRRKSNKQGRVQFRQFKHMDQRLHQMLRSLGQEQVQNASIKLDQFEKLRQQFVSKAAELQNANNAIGFQNDRVQRAKLLYTISDSKHILQSNLRQMTALVMKLDQKVKRKVNREEDSPEGRKTDREKDKYYQVEGEEERESPLQKELEYKMLTLYTLEKTYFRLTKKEAKEVGRTRDELANKKYESLEAFKRDNPQIDRLLEPGEELGLEEKEMLEALKRIDRLIEQRMDKILEGVKLMNYNAVSISKGLEDVHRQILINLDRVEHNQENLRDNQKRIEEAAKVVTKPSCICNVVIVVLLGLIGYLLVKLLWLDN